MSIAIGKLDKRITIQTRSMTDDGFTTKESWSDSKSTWASASWLSDNQRYIAASAGRDLTMRFVIRRIPDLNIDHTMRVKFGNQTFSIDGAKPHKDDLQFIEITAGLVRS